MSETTRFPERPDRTILLCGAAGQGLQTIEKALATACRRHGLHVCTSKQYMSRVRGGTVSTVIRVSSRPVKAIRRHVDVAVPFTAEALAEEAGRLTDESVVVLDPNLGIDRTRLAGRVVDVPLLKTARSLGNRLVANGVVAGLLGAWLGLDVQKMAEEVAALFAPKGDAVVDMNRRAVLAGAGMAADRPTRLLQLPVAGREPGQSRPFLNGSQAVGIGALAGGCRLLAAYPMSPGTGVLTFLAGQAEGFGLVVEQVEDEIAALNMAIGGSYAGGRSMVTTSGGGFALMTEAVSLAAITETPVVIHVAQRPGPATGLPTRTEQADLDLVLHAGHGEFARVVYAPGSPDEAIRLTKEAFDISERFQVPAFVLTDQYLVDTAWDVDMPDVAVSNPLETVVPAEPGYARYRITDDGISPRAVPGYGDGLVVVSGNEHDESGHPTEAIEIRNTMNVKRLKRLAALADVAVPPTVAGVDDARWTVVCWGSTGAVIMEAVEWAGLPVRVLHFGQVFPLHPKAVETMRQAERMLVVEQNATGQFERLLAGRYGVRAHARVHKTDGRPFTVEELGEAIANAMQGGAA